MCVLSIKAPIRKKSGNLFNDPRNKKKIIWFRPTTDGEKRKPKVTQILTRQLKRKTGKKGWRWNKLHLIRLERSPKAWKKNVVIGNQTKNRDHPHHGIVKINLSIFLVCNLVASLWKQIVVAIMSFTRRYIFGFLSLLLVFLFLLLCIIISNLKLIS